MGLQPYALNRKKKSFRISSCLITAHASLQWAGLRCCNLVSVHELLADNVLTDAGGRHQVVQLVEELHAALVVLRGSFTQLAPQNQRYTLETTFEDYLQTKAP